MAALSRAATREFIKKHAIPYDMLSIRARFPHLLSKKESPFCAACFSDENSLPILSCCGKMKKLLFRISMPQLALTNFS